MAISKITSDAIDATGFNLDSDTLTVDATNNRVGMGTNSPASTLHLKAASGNTAINIQDAAGSPNVSWLDSAGTVQWQLYSTMGGAAGLDPLVVYSSAGEKVRFQTGGGISFNGDTSADNALDDYEIGSWTPAYAVSGGSFSHSLQIGSYVKIGELVTATCRIRGQRSGGSGAVYMSGLPYTSRNIANLHAACSIGFTNSWINAPKGAFVGTNVTQINFKKAGSSSALSNFPDDLDAADAATSSTSNNDLILSVTYIAN
tara:strand:+ start:49 stop:825 length:777 start_codon:yes stop_codon:yes gene_type:complete